MAEETKNTETQTGAEPANTTEAKAGAEPAAEPDAKKSASSTEGEPWHKDPRFKQDLGLLKAAKALMEKNNLESVDDLVELAESGKADFKPLYELELPLKPKVEKIATEIYGAKDVEYSKNAEKALKEFTEHGYGNLPVCMAKTQNSLSDDPSKKGAPTGFTLQVKDCRLSAGAGFVVVLTGDILTMPGLPKVPSAEKIDVSDDGVISGLF